MKHAWKFQMACDEVVDLLMREIEARGFSVHRSFDLRSARDSLREPQNCSCPHHGTAQCACQYVVMLVRAIPHQPASIVAHGHDHETIISIDRSPSADTSNHDGEILREIISGVMSLSV